MSTQPITFSASDQVKGIDVSHNNGTVDWKKIAASGIGFAFAKATEGDAFLDPQFDANYNGIQSNGIICGAYHFFRPGKNAQAQAESFLKTVQALKPVDLMPALDVEVNDNKAASDTIAGIQLWMDTVAVGLNSRPILYTSASFWNANLGGTGQFADYPLWVAHYTSDPQPNIPKGFSGYAIWQFTEQGAVSGVSGNVDLNRYNGSVNDLRRLWGVGKN